MAMNSWEVSDTFWSKVKPLIPRARRDSNREYQRRRGAGRKPLEARRGERRKLQSGKVIKLDVGLWKWPIYGSIASENFWCVLKKHMPHTKPCFNWRHA